MLGGEQALKQMYDDHAKESFQCSFVWVPISTGIFSFTSTTTIIQHASMQSAQSQV